MWRQVTKSGSLPSSKPSLQSETYHPCPACFNRTSCRLHRHFIVSPAEGSDSVQRPSPRLTTRVCRNEHITNKNHVRSGKKLQQPSPVSTSSMINDLYHRSRKTKACVAGCRHVRMTRTRAPARHPARMYRRVPGAYKRASCQQVLNIERPKKIRPLTEELGHSQST